MAIISANISDELALQVQSYCDESAISVSGLVKDLLKEKLSGEVSLTSIYSSIEARSKETTRQFQNLAKILMLNMEMEGVTQNFLLMFVSGYIREKKGPMTQERREALEMLEKKMEQNTEQMAELDELMKKF